MRIEVPARGSFDAKFQPTEMRLFGGTIRTVDISSEIRRPDKPTPVLVLPGWSSGLEANKGPIRVLEGAGRRVLSTTHIREKDGGMLDDSYSQLSDKIHQRLVSQGVDQQEVAGHLIDLFERWEFLRDNFSEESIRRAMTIVGMLEEKGVEKVDIVAHSEGAIDAVTAKFLCPDKIGNLVLVAPAGMMGKDNLLRLAVGNIRQGRIDRREWRKRADETPGASVFDKNEDHMRKDQLSPQDVSERATEYWNANRQRAFAELRALTDPVDLLYKTTRIDGSKIVVIHAVDDPLFPMKKMQKRGMFTVDEFEEVEIDGIKNRNLVNRGTVDGFLSIQGNHGTMFTDHRVMQLADYALTTMANPSE